MAALAQLRLISLHAYTYFFHFYQTCREKCITHRNSSRCIKSINHGIISEMRIAKSTEKLEGSQTTNQVFTWSFAALGRVFIFFLLSFLLCVSFVQVSRGRIGLWNNERSGCPIRIYIYNCVTRWVQGQRERALRCRERPSQAAHTYITAHWSVHASGTTSHGFFTAPSFICVCFGATVSSLPSSFPWKKKRGHPHGPFSLILSDAFEFHGAYIKASFPRNPKGALCIFSLYKVRGKTWR